MGEPAKRKRCKMDGPVSRLAEEPRTIRDMMNREQAAAHLGMSLDDFNFYLLLGRLPPAENDGWLSDRLVLRSRRATDPNPRSGIYIVQFMSFVKIGFSDDILRRIANIQDTLPTRIKVIGIFEGRTRKGERSVHRKFAKYRTRGEWYNLEGKLVAWIEGGCK